MTRHEVNYAALATEQRNPFTVQMPDDMDQPPPRQHHASPHRTENTTTEDEEAVTDTDNDDAPRDSGLMIHVVPDTSKARWNHIEDLDSFFTRMYNYHQKHGFAVMMLQEVFELGQFVFVVVFTTFLIYGVNYPVLFGDEKKDYSKIHIADAVYTAPETVSAISGWSWLVIAITMLFWVFRTIKVMYHAVQYWDVKKFYNTALKIGDDELDNLTWHEVQRRIRDVQSELQMCIHKPQLSELDIYHRILRFKNYMVAMMNKSLIPSRIWVPVLGECVVFSRGLRYNIELILFRGPWSPFENNWHLKEEFKRAANRQELAAKLARQITWIALAHFVLSPLIFLWALMLFFFSYADLFKREPGQLGTRCWSQYGTLYMRHFNELDHELNARLSRAYRPAVKYMNTFSSPLLAVIAGNVVFICGGVLSVLLLLTIYDEDVVQVQHMITLIAALSGLVVISRVFIPDENLIVCPEQLMTAVLAHTHYLPITWRGLAHTARVRDQFGQFFQFRFTYLLNELLSPLVTPYVLMFYFRPRALDLVDFFRNFTVAVVGVGDVCSFAQMDVRKHGNPDWQPDVAAAAAAAVDPTATAATAIPAAPICETNHYTQGEHGKTELSLMHFTLTNPGWRMPLEARQFVHGIRRHAMHDLDEVHHVHQLPGAGAATAMEQSLNMVNSMGGEYASIVQLAVQTRALIGGGGGGGAMQSSSQCSYGVRNPFADAAAGTAHDQQQQQQQHQQRTHQLPARAPTASYDFQHMLNQNMSMDADLLSGGGGGPQSANRSQMLLLDSIQEHAEAAAAGGGAATAHQQQQSHPSSALLTSSVLRAPAHFGAINRSSAAHANQTMLATSMGASVVGGLRLREGPLAGSQDGFLHSVFAGRAPRDAFADQQQLLGGHPTEVTATDMCLSTLYLHELHHRQLRRRGRSCVQPAAAAAAASHFGAGGGDVESQSAYAPASTPGSPSSSSLPMATLGGVAGSSSAVENTPLLSGGGSGCAKKS